MIRSALSLAMAALLAAPLAAQCRCQDEGGHHRMPPHEGPGRDGRPEMGPMMMRGLDLTEAQRKSLKAIAAKHREATKGKHEAAMEAMKAFHEAMMDPSTPPEKLKALHEKASKAQFEVALGRRALMQESMAILTPEQKAKAEKLRAERPKDGRPRMPRRGEGPGHHEGRGPEGHGPEGHGHEGMPGKAPEGE